MGIKALVDGLEMIINALVKMEKSRILIFNEWIGRKVYDRISKVLVSDNVEVFYDRLDMLFSLIKKNEHVNVFFISERSLRPIIHQLVHDLRERLCKTIIIYVSENEKSTEDLRFELAKIDMLILEPSTPEDIYLFLIGSYWLAEKTGASVAIRVHLESIFMKKEVDFAVLKEQFDENEYSSIKNLSDLKEIAKFVTSKVNLEYGNTRSQYLIIVSGSLSIDVIEKIFMHELLQSVTITKIGLTYPIIEEFLLKIFVNKTHIIIIDTSEFLSVQIKKGLFNLYSRGLIDAMPIIVDKDNLDIVLEESIFVALNSVFREIGMIKEVRKKMALENVSTIYPKPTIGVYLVYFLKVLKQKWKKRTIFLIYKSESLYEMLVNVLEESDRIKLIKHLKEIEVMNEKRTKKVIIVPEIYQDIFKHEYRSLMPNIDSIYIIHLFKIFKEGLMKKLDFLKDSEVIQVKHINDLLFLEEMITEKTRKLHIVLSPMEKDSTGRYPWINLDFCTGCLECIHKTACPAIGLLLHGSLFIDTIICSRCDLCLNICPEKAISYV